MKNQEAIETLRKTIERKGISQRELAKKIGKDETTISRWFAGKVGMSDKTVKLLEEALGENLTNSKNPNMKTALITAQCQTSVDKYL